MEWLGLVCLGLMLCFASYPRRVRRLEKKLKKTEMKFKGDSNMSKLISELVGKRCKIKTLEDLVSFGNDDIICNVLDADDDWMRIAYEDKKAGKVIKIIRIEDISSVVEMPEL